MQFGIINSKIIVYFHLIFYYFYKRFKDIGGGCIDMAKKEKKQKQASKSIVNTIVTQMSKHVGCVLVIIAVISLVTVWS